MPLARFEPPGAVGEDDLPVDRRWGLQDSPKILPDQDRRKPEVGLDGVCDGTPTLV